LKLHLKHNTSYLLSALLILTILFNAQTKAQTFSKETGLPHLINYSSRQYKAHDQNWCMVQDSLGLIYIGNNIGLLVFDGLEFDYIQFESMIYSLAVDKKGNVYYGADGDFGIVQQNEFGKLKLNSLAKLISKELNTFNEIIWTIKCIDGHVFFSSNEHIFDYYNDKITALNPSKGNSIHKCFELKNKYLVREFGGGFSYYSNKQLNFIKGSEIFADIMVDFVQEIDNKIVIGTRQQGFYEMSWDPTSSPDQCIISPLDFPVAKNFIEGQLYYGILLSDHKFCFATKNAGVFVTDLQGNILEHYSKEKGLSDNRVWYLLEDKYKNLWAATNKGISMIDYHTPIRQYNSIQGLSGTINDVTFINNKLYISSGLGLFEGEETPNGLIFKPHPNFKMPIISISQFSSKNTSDLIVCSNTGLTAVRGNTIIEIEEGIEFNKSLQCIKNPQLLIAAGKQIITIYKFENNQYKLISEFEYSSQFRSIIEDDDGFVWITGDNRTLIKLNPNQGKEAVFEVIPIKVPVEVKSENYIFKHQGKVFFSYNDIYEIVSNKNKVEFVPQKTLPPQFHDNNNYIFRAYSDKKENIWLAYDNQSINGIVAKISKGKNNNFEFNNLLFNQYQNIQKNGFCEDNVGNLWIATNEGLLKYNTNQEMHYKHEFPVFIKKITLKNDSSYSLLRGHIPDDLKKILPFELNAISFNFSVANYSDVENIKFSSRLLPMESNFSEWSLLRTKDYNYLPEGTYTLEVKAKDIFNNISDTKKFTFEIAAPWYRTTVAYVAYFLLSVILIYLLIKFNTKRLRAINDLLDKTVKERTHELWEERDKLKDANLEITDSINYARIIQQSILPEVKSFNKTFKDSFILFKPRNIVSGDFYWFSLAGSHKKSIANFDQHIIVAADCTGHGVPGAFMSMIGSEKLNQSVAEIVDLSPANILSFMNKQIKDSLKQETSNSQSKDGMELALCFFDSFTNVLTFAGANRPLWIYRKGCTIDDIEIIKPTKAGIAGHTSVNQVFEQTEIQLYSGDTFYLFTDGAPDQFGGPKNKKLTTKGLRQLLFDIQSQTMEQQGKSINGFYRSWMGSANEQVDDILIIGIRV
jgi:serine phosphatase RsbU (regulator of sigma subunit)/ligand-binding sensor domain-containing protein